MSPRAGVNLRRGLRRAVVVLAVTIALIGLLRAFVRLVLPESEGAPLVDLVLDPGHGGMDSGALATGRTRLQEKDVTLDIARRAAALLKAAGLRVVLTREDDETVSLAERLARAHRLGGSGVPLVSVHCNHADARAAAGIETWHTSAADGDTFAEQMRRWWARFLGRDAGPAPAERATESERLAQCLQRALASQARRPDRGVRDGPLFITRRASGPAVLVECGFVSNPAEAALLALDSHRQRLAESLTRGILDFRNAAER